MREPTNPQLQLGELDVANIKISIHWDTHFFFLTIWGMLSKKEWVSQDACRVIRKTPWES